MCLFLSMQHSCICVLPVAYLGFCKGGGQIRGSGGQKSPAGSEAELQPPAVFCDFEANSMHFEAPFNG